MLTLYCINLCYIISNNKSEKVLGYMVVFYMILTHLGTVSLSKLSEQDRMTE